MPRPRLFVRQDTLDRWLELGRATLEEDVLVLETDRFRLRTGLHVMREVSGAPDNHDLVNKVKDLDQIGALGGEHVAGSLLVGESAYDVVEGFVGEWQPLDDARVSRAPGGPAPEDLAFLAEAFLRKK